LETKAEGRRERGTWKGRKKEDRRICDNKNDRSKDKTEGTPGTNTRIRRSFSLIL